MTEPLKAFRVICDAYEPEPITVLKYAKNMHAARMSPRERDVLEHSIGEWTGRPGTKPYRNYYCTGASDSVVCMCVRVGWMRASHTINDGRDTIFVVTEEGFKALGLPYVEPDR